MQDMKDIQELEFIPAADLPATEAEEVDVLCVENGELKRKPGASFGGGSDPSEKVNWNDIENKPFGEDVNVLFDGELQTDGEGFAYFPEPLSVASDKTYKFVVFNKEYVGTAYYDYDDQCWYISGYTVDNEYFVISNISVGVGGENANATIHVMVGEVTLTQIPERYVADSVYPKLGPFYAVSQTEATTAAKVAWNDMYYGLKELNIMIPGVVVNVLFDKANTASNPTLNVNRTGDLPIYDYSTNTNIEPSALTRGIHSFLYSTSGRWYMMF